MRHPTTRQTIESRVSVQHFDPCRSLTEDVIRELTALATQAPSAYNLQNWRFIAVRSVSAKARLQAVAYGQQKVLDASMVFIVCGVLAAHERLAEVLEPAVEAGLMTRQVAGGWVAQATRTHAGNPQRQHDEAIRSASLAAMTLMLAAQGMGLGSCPMVGFDAQELSREFGLDGSDVPVMLLALGYPADGNGPQKPRRPLSEVLEFV